MARAGDRGAGGVSAGVSERVQAAALGVVSAAIAGISWRWPETVGAVEAVSSVSLLWCVWLLARNHPAGWWLGIVSNATYAQVFYEGALYAEVGLQAVYCLTSLQAIWIWVRGGGGGEERPVSRLPRGWWIVAGVVVGVGTLGLSLGLEHVRGAAPGWDALTTVLSLVAHVLLMGRYVESWYLWVLVDTIYVPFYASQGYYVSAGVFAVLWVLAVKGLQEFRRLADA